MSHTAMIDAATVAAHLGDPRWAIIDCRFRLADPGAGHRLYLESHIPGALYADLDRDLAGPPGGDGGRHPLPPLDDFRATLSRWGIDGGTQVVAYDDAGGMIAARLWWMLGYLGHEAVAVLDGGFPAWVSAGYPVAGGEEARPPTRFTGEPDPTRLATMAEVEAMVARGEGAGLVDGRGAARYRGEVEPLDPVAGHIPGARNRPYPENLDEGGRMRPADELANQWGRLLGETPPDETIHYCGSGVSACHNLLAMRHAGLALPRLFVPSWSGWSADPARPIARGE